MNNPITAPVYQEESVVDPGVLQTLAGLNASANLAVVQRTRRAVMMAAQELRERRSRSRRNMAIAVLTIAVFAMVLTPAIWSTLDDFLGGEDFFEMHNMIMVLILLLFSAMLGVLVLGLHSDSMRMPHKRR